MWTVIQVNFSNAEVNEVRCFGSNERKAFDYATEILLKNIKNELGVDESDEDWQPDESDRDVYEDFLELDQSSYDDVKVFYQNYNFDSDVNVFVEDAIMS